MVTQIVVNCFYHASIIEIEVDAQITGSCLVELRTTLMEVKGFSHTCKKSLLYDFKKEVCVKNHSYAF